MPGLALTFVGLFHQSNIGLELTAIIMIFTGQVWNMTLSFYHSLCSVPTDMREAAKTFRFNWWQISNWVEVPYAAIGLVWNSMMSMSGGWFFDDKRGFCSGSQRFQTSRLGSYMSIAVNQGNFPAMVYAIIAMIVMIVFLDIFLWRPVAVWSQKFKIEETGQQFATSSSFILNLLKKAGLLQYTEGIFIYLIDVIAGSPSFKKRCK